jgi:hypothetical protein
MPDPALHLDTANMIGERSPNHGASAADHSGARDTGRRIGYSGNQSPHGPYR